MKVCVEREHRVINGEIADAQIRIDSPSISANVLNIDTLIVRYELDIIECDDCIIVNVPFCSLKIQDRLQGLLNAIADVDKTTLVSQGNHHLHKVVSSLDIPAGT